MIIFNISRIFGIYIIILCIMILNIGRKKALFGLLSEDSDR